MKVLDQDLSIHEEGCVTEFDELQVSD